jgi:hypothetical protein
MLASAVCLNPRHSLLFSLAAYKTAAPQHATNRNSNLGMFFQILAIRICSYYFPRSISWCDLQMSKISNKVMTWQHWRLHWQVSWTPFISRQPPKCHVTVAFCPDLRILLTFLVPLERWARISLSVCWTARFFPILSTDVWSFVRYHSFLTK